MTSRREGRSNSLGRHRERQSRDQSRSGIDDESSTLQNVSNFMLALQRVKAAEDENRQLRKENQLLRQRARSSRLSSGSFSGGGTTYRSISPVATTGDVDTAMNQSESEDKIIMDNVKRNSLIFVGDTLVPTQSPEHVALEAQYKKLQTDFGTLKDFLKHLFHHALTLSHSSPTSMTQDDQYAPIHKDSNTCPKEKDVNTYNPIFSKELEHSLEDIHREIPQLHNSQDQQKIRMEQVQQALDNVLNQSSVRNDVTMRIVRQQDKMKTMQRRVTYLENRLMEMTKSLRQAQERLSRVDKIQHNMDFFISSNRKNLKGATRSDLNRYLDQMSQLKQSSRQPLKMVSTNKMVAHIVSASSNGQSLMDTKPPIDVIEGMSKLERLIGSDWHRFGRMLGLNVDCLDDIGKFTNFDLTTRVEKVMATWSRTQKDANGDLLKQALTKMDRDVLLLTDVPVSKDMCPIPPDVLAFFVAHVVDVSSICHSLAWQGILSQDSIVFIAGVAEEYKRASRLIHTIVFMGLGALESLCHVLDTSNQTHVAFKLKGCLPSQCEDNTREDIHSPSTRPHHSMVTSSSSSPTPQSIKTQHSSTDNEDNNKVDNNSLNTSSSSSTSHHRPKLREKQGHKRSRSLFARKNTRDKELSDQVTVRDHSDVRNTQISYYPVTMV